MDHNHRVAGLLGADALGLAPVCENSLLNAWIWRSIYIIKIEEEVLGPCRPKGAFRDCFVCAHLPDGIDVDGSTPFKRVAMFDGVCTHIRYAEGGNALCCGTLDHFVGEPNRKIEATRATVVADAVREGGTPPPPPISSAHVPAGFAALASSGWRSTNKSPTAAGPDLAAAIFSLCMRAI